MIIGGLTFRIYLSKNFPLLEGFKILLSDRESENIFHKDNFNVDGFELKTSIKAPGYNLYDLKIHKKAYVEDHKDFRCNNYAKFGDYNSVRRSYMYKCNQLSDPYFFSVSPSFISGKVCP